MRWIAILAALGALGVLALQAYARLKPLDAATYHALPEMPGAGPGLWQAEGSARLAVAPGEDAALADWDRVIRETPRTRVLAGSVDEGMVSYVTRSLIWGFPDITTIARGPDGLIVIRTGLVIGRSDLGQSAARVADWTGRLGISPPPARDGGA